MVGESGVGGEMERVGSQRWVGKLLRLGYKIAIRGPIDKAIIHGKAFAIE